MSDVVIRVEHLSKHYRLGQIGGGTLREDLHRWWARRRGLRDPRPEIDRPKQGNQSTEDIWALREVSFDVREGDILGIIGRNGAGKSTLLKIFSRITAPTSGFVKIRGRISSLIEVGTGFHPELSGRENIYLNGAIMGMTRAEVDRKFDEIVDFSGVEQFIDTPVKRYSSGMHVRLGFAVAANLEPEILVIDEVLAVGDAVFQRKCLGKMGDVAKEGRTILFVSHQMAMISNLCRRTLHLSHGRIQEVGNTPIVISNYLAELAERSSIDLALRTDRTGTGLVRFTRVDLLSNSGRLVEHVASGDDVTIRLHYESQTPRRQNCRFSIAVWKDERPFMLFSNSLVSNDEVAVSASGYVDCVVPGPLAEGRYFLEVHLESDGETHDWVQSAAPLSVVDGDYFGTGRNYPMGWQGRVVLVKHHWASPVYD